MYLCVADRGRLCCGACLFFVLLFQAFAAWAADPAIDPFRANVRPTEPLTPAVQQSKFHLPPGFRIELVAADPQIYKPMNMAFDAAGRLWVSESKEYPFAAAEGKGRDRIQVLEDTDGDGRLDQTRTFVEGLNIPIGLLPYRDGVIAYSIPNIYFFRDTDGDGRCDRRDVLYGPLGQPRDTHGMQNAFRRGFDGWIYVCHGFSNESTITAKDGGSIRLQSGNTYRIRPDGSRVEQFTWGQVNPFGSTFTPWGDLITADCHSKPLTLLLRGGYYSSFGKPHDGLGFVPPLMEHLHGSTAIAGAAYYSAPAFPAAYDGKLFVGNVVTSRINCDRLVFQGATAKAIEQADFLTCDDPWFRPVDVQIAPDGSLYVADFYNRIIGHYEVPLDHPGRDRLRGRIWRISYEGVKQNAQRKPTPSKRMDRLNVEQLIAAINDGNLKRNMLAIDELSDRFGARCEASARAALLAPDSDGSRRLAMLWVLHRLRRVKDSDLQFAVKHGDSILKTHAMRVISESESPSTLMFAIASKGLQDKSALVRRNSADALGRLRDLQSLKPLLEALGKVDQKDIYLMRTMQIAIRETLKVDGAFQRIASLSLDDASLHRVADISLATPTAAAAQFLLDIVIKQSLPPNRTASYLTHVAAHLPIDRFGEFVRLVRGRIPVESGLQHELLIAIEGKLAARGLAPTAEVKSWAAELAADWLNRAAQEARDWRVVSGDNCWDLEPRRCADGEQATFLSSLSGGEKARSVLRSKAFQMPERLSFYLCGHRGPPDKPADNRNFVVLRSKGGKELARVFPPRNDVARKVEWSDSDWTGTEVYLELVDQCNLNAYAWLAVSRFEPELLRLPAPGRRDFAKRVVTAAQIAASFKLSPLADKLQSLVADERCDLQVRVACAIAHAQLKSNWLGESFASIASESRTPAAWKSRLIAGAIGEKDPHNLLLEFMREASAPLQRTSAITLCSNIEGAKALLALIEQGAASRRLLQDRTVLQNLAVFKRDDLNRRVQALTKGLAPVGVELQQKVNALVAATRAAKTSNALGKAVFEKNCQACHQVAGKGAKIGPQLDGIGNRGLARVAEDLLDSNRNVDAAFRVLSLALRDGRVVSGLLRRKEGDQLVLADEKGKEFRVDAAQIETQNLTLNSLMPSNFGEQLRPQELRNLLGYLSTLRAKSPPQAEEK